MYLRQSCIALAILLSLAWTCLFAVSAPLAKARQGREASTVVFIISANKLPSASITPILMIEQGSYKNPIAGDSDAETISRFAADYYRKGQKYRVLFGGGEAGTLTVQRSTKDQECMRTEAEVLIQSSASSIQT